MKTLLIPRQQNSLDPMDELPFGMTHPNDTPCPFANDKLPTGYINTCCSFNSEVAANNLALFGDDTLSRLLHNELEAEKLLIVAKEVRRAADLFEGQYVEPTGTHDGARTGGTTDLVTGEFTSWQRHRFEEALASIRQAADWYEKVGRLGFDVGVWY